MHHLCHHLRLLGVVEGDTFAGAFQQAYRASLASLPCIWQRREKVALLPPTLVGDLGSCVPCQLCRPLYVLPAESTPAWYGREYIQSCVSGFSVRIVLVHLGYLIVGVCLLIVCSWAVHT